MSGSEIMEIRTHLTQCLACGRFSILSTYVRPRKCRSAGQDNLPRRSPTVTKCPFTKLEQRRTQGLHSQTQEGLIQESSLAQLLRPPSALLGWISPPGSTLHSVCISPQKLGLYSTASWPAGAASEISLYLPLAAFETRAFLWRGPRDPAERRSPAGFAGPE